MKPMRKDFAVVIISHGRPNCETVKTLRESGYTGEIYIVVDDEDKTKDEYLRLYGEDHVHIFHKHEWFDVGDNLDSPRTVGVFARNECLKVAKEHKLKYYLEMDDDLKSLSFRYNDNGHLRGKPVKKFDAVLEAICDYFDNSTIDCLGFGNAVDYIGGVPTFEHGRTNRLPMNSFFLRTSNDFLWKGRNSDDLITPLNQQKIGEYWCKFIPVQATYDVWSPKKGSKEKGGSIELYNELGSYRLRFYGVVFHPSSVKLTITPKNMDCTARSVNTYPCLVSQKVRKT